MPKVSVTTAPDDSAVMFNVPASFAALTAAAILVAKVVGASAAP